MLRLRMQQLRHAFSHHEFDWWISVNVKNIYNFSGVEWSYERDRMMQKKIDAALRKAGQIEFSAEDETMIEKIKLEILGLKSFGKEMPDLDDISKSDWVELLKNKDRYQYYRYLVKKSIRRKISKERGKTPATFSETRSEDGKNEAKTHRGVSCVQGVFLDRRNVKNVLNLRALLNKQYGIPLVFDFDFVSRMSSQEIKKVMIQVETMYGANKGDSDPFHLVYANAHLDQEYAVRQFECIRRIDSLYLDWSEDCYTKLFSKDKLVYLTPASNNVLQEFDPTDVYVVNSVVQPSRPNLKLDYEKAQRQGIRTAKIPFNKYGRWRGKPKDLPLHIILDILLDMKKYRCWKTAFSNIPPSMFCFR